ncbi:peptide deformylase [bacterium]|jgi:peptide deformylase|nr:peptide deformylase [bacterium]
MIIIPIHYLKSLPVENWEQIKIQAEELKKFMDDNNGTFDGREGCALHHSQVSDKPFNFFVVNRKLIPELVFKYRIIINPKLIKGEGMKIKMPEGCMSFPFRKEKYVERYYKVRVEYQVPVMFGKLKTITENLTGLQSQVFQHECDHGEGKNIYFEN